MLNPSGSFEELKQGGPISQGSLTIRWESPAQLRTVKGPIEAAALGAASPQTRQTPLGPVVAIAGDGNGLALDVASARVNRTLRLYAGVLGGSAIITACVPDAGCYSDITFRSSSTAFREYALNFTGGLHIEFRQLYGSVEQSAVLIYGAALTTNARREPPRVRIVSPKQDSTFNVSAPITLDAQASSARGQIARVEFYGGSVALNLGAVKAPPYRIVVQRPRAFLGSVTARAYDDTGLAIDSDSVLYRVASDEPAASRVQPISEDYVSSAGPALPFQTVASVEELADGSLLAVWMAGKYELSPDSATYSARLPIGSDHWSAPRVMIKSPYLGASNAVLKMYNGALWCFYSKAFGYAIEFVRLFYRKSLDGGQTWGPEAPLPDAPAQYQTGILPSTRPLALSNGDLLVPLNRESYDPDPKRQWVSLFLRSSDHGRDWRLTEGLYSLPGNIQPAVVELEHGKLVAFCRPRGQGHTLWRTTSNDYGVTWSALEQSDIENPSARVALLRLRSGKLIMAFNRSGSARTPLSLALSSDDGRTWTAALDIETGGYAYTYPYMIQSRDGRIHVVYTEGYRAIKHAVVDERWFQRKAPPHSVAAAGN